MPDKASHEWTILDRGVFSLPSFSTVLLSTTGIILFTSVLFGPLDEEVLSPDDQALGYSTGQLALSYSFWLQIAAVTLLGVNTGMIIISQTYRDPEEEGSKGVPQLMKTAQKEDVL